MRRGSDFVVVMEASDWISTVGNVGYAGKLTQPVQVLALDCIAHDVGVNEPYINEVESLMIEDDGFEDG